jgi:YggT family protein
MSFTFLLVRMINAVAYIFSLLVIAKIILSYFMSPYHAVRRFIDGLVDPLLRPIQRVVPPLGGMVDLSPLILLILVEILASLLVRLILTLG